MSDTRKREGSAARRKPDPDRVRRLLVSWYRRTARDLPWRSHKDPYAILVSEFMLQQTTVRAVIPYYESFLRRFPGWTALADAPEQDVLAAWSGLGYYSRARNLRRTARQILQEEGGEFPRNVERARMLPGVGPYTAGAVLSIAYDIPEPALDGNTLRVLARLSARRGNVRAAGVRSELEALARRLLPRRGASVLNQALMELGATHCAPSSPSCLICPVRSECRAAKEGLTAVIPAPAPRPAAVHVVAGAVAVKRHGRFLLVRRPPDELMGGLWEFPGTVASELEASSARRGGRTVAPTRAPAKAETNAGASVLAVRLRRHLRRRYSLKVRVEAPAGTVHHTITYRRLSVELFEGGLSGERPAGPFRWTAPAELSRLPSGALTRKLIALLTT